MGVCARILLDPETGLTPKQKVFTQKFIETGQVTKSAIAAYPNTTKGTAAVIGTENLKIPNVLKAIEAAYRKEGVSEDWAKLRARQYVDRGVKDYKFSSAGVNALGKVMKMLGMIRDAGDEGSVNITFNVLNISHDEIGKRAELLSSRLQALGGLEKASGVPKDEQSRLEASN